MVQVRQELGLVDYLGPPAVFFTFLVIVFLISVRSMLLLIYILTLLCDICS